MTDGYERLSQLRHDTFESYVGDTFIVDDDVELVLVEVALSKHSSEQSGTNGQTRDSFSLLFEGSHPASLESGIHQLKHPTLQELPLFISPVHIPSGQNDDPPKYYYESVFA